MKMTKYYNHRSDLHYNRQVLMIIMIDSIVTFFAYIKYKICLALNLEDSYYSTIRD